MTALYRLRQLIPAIAELRVTSSSRSGACNAVDTLKAKICFFKTRFDELGAAVKVPTLCWLDTNDNL